MFIKERTCKSCTHFRPPVAGLPAACVMGNRQEPLADDICDEHQNQHEAKVDRAMAIMRGVVLKARDCK